MFWKPIIETKDKIKGEEKKMDKIKLLEDLCNTYYRSYKIKNNGYIELYDDMNGTRSYHYNIDKALISFLDILRYVRKDGIDVYEKELEFIEELNKETKNISQKEINKIMKSVRCFAEEIGEKIELVNERLNILEKEICYKANTEDVEISNIKIGDYISLNLEESDSPILTKVILLDKGKYALIEDDKSAIVGKEYGSLKEIEEFAKETDSIIYYIKDRLEWEVGGKYLIHDNTGDSDFDTIIKYFEEDKTFRLMFGETDAYFYEDEPFYSIEELSCRVLKDFSLVKQLR